jgi:hypothetical protein
MDTRLEAKLIEGLSALDEGESIEQVLARYPDDAARLRPYLAAAKQLPAMRMQPSEAQKLKSREVFLNQAAALRQSKRRTIGFLPRFAASLAALAVVIGVVSVGAVSASSSARPGDPLYGLKRTVENARLALSPDDSARGALAAQFEQTRVDEVKSLVDDKRAEMVDFSGSIEALQPNAWIVANVAISVNSSTRITGTPLLGAHAHVQGETEDTGVVANEIEVDFSGTPQPTPSVDYTPTPASEDTPRPTPTPSAPRPSPEPPSETTLSSGAAPTPESTETEFSGAVQTIGTQSWTIDGTLVLIDASTQIESGISIGQPVKVKALKLSNGNLLATEISKVAAADNPTVKPTEDVQPTDTPEATHPPEATDTPEATQQPEATDRPEATQQPEATETPHN